MRLYFQYHTGSAADFRNWILPKLGIKGAALATGIGQIITVIVYLIYYVKKPLPVKLKKSCLPLQRSLDFRLYTIGVPAILNLALPSF